MTYTKELIVSKLASEPVWVERALCAIYARQTASEQLVQETRIQNGIGFTGADAFIFSSFAKQIESKAARGVLAGQRLSDKQLALARRLNAKGSMKIAKYAGQLLKVIEEKGQ